MCKFRTTIIIICVDRPKMELTLCKQNHVQHGQKIHYTLELSK